MLLRRPCSRTPRQWLTVSLWTGRPRHRRALDMADSRFERTLPSIFMLRLSRAFPGRPQSIDLLGALVPACVSGPCPRGHRANPSCGIWSNPKILGGALMEARLEPVQQCRARIPCVSASFKALAHVRIRCCGRTQPVRLFQHTAPFGRVFGFASPGYHLAIPLSGRRCIARA